MATTETDIEPAVPRDGKARNDISFGIAASLFAVVLALGSLVLLSMGQVYAVVLAIIAVPIGIWGNRRIRRGGERMR